MKIAVKSEDWVDIYLTNPFHADKEFQLDIPHFRIEIKKNFYHPGAWNMQVLDSCGGICYSEAIHTKRENDSAEAKTLAVQGAYNYFRGKAAYFNDVASKLIKQE